ncbi:MAG: hypothetical protein KJO69_00470 [Gammaproteobacteria bacterium]|nr:hypothetical protein [Gammaproteobacteria bacterium]
MLKQHRAAKVILFIVSIVSMFLAVRYSPVSASLIHEFIAQLYPAVSGETNNISTQSGRTFLVLNIAFLAFSLVLGMTIVVATELKKRLGLYILMNITSLLLVAVASPLIWPREVLMQMSGMLLLLFLLVGTAGLWCFVSYYYAKFNEYETWHMLYQYTFKSAFFLVINLGLVLATFQSVILAFDLFEMIKIEESTVEVITIVVSSIFSLLMIRQVFANNCRD